MPTKAASPKEETIKLTAPPETGEFVSHEFLINSTVAAAKSNNLVVKDVRYRSSNDNKAVLAEFVLENPDEKSGDFVVCWFNTYERSYKRFSIMSGMEIRKGEECAIYTRTFTEKRDRKSGQTKEQSVLVAIEEAIKAHTDSTTTKDITEVRNSLETENASVQYRAAILGEMFFIHDLLNVTQAANIKKSMKEESISMFEMLSDVLLYTREDHPSKFMDKQVSILEKMEEYADTRKLFKAEKKVASITPEKEKEQSQESAIQFGVAFL